MAGVMVTDRVMSVTDAGFLIRRLEPGTALEFARYTFPKYQPLLGSDSSATIIGARKNQDPVGLAIGLLSPGSGRAKILSVAVSAAHRNRGLGTALLSSLEGELASSCGYADAVFMGGTPTSEYVHRMLERRGWGQIQKRSLFCRSDNVESLMSAPWFRRSCLGGSFQILPWHQITPAEKRAVRERRVVSYEETLSPFIQEDSIEPVTSMALRYQGELAGWLITHLIAPDLLRVTRMFVREDLRKRARAVPMIVESIVRYIDHPDIRVNPKRGIWDIDVNNAPMIQFAHRRLAPFMTSMYFSYGASKTWSRD